MALPLKFFSIIILSLLVSFITPAFSQEIHIVKRVIDGDTLLLDNGERVRLIGVDTPEVHESAKLNKDAERTKKDKATIKALGKRSSEFTRNLCNGKSVTLEYDQANSPGKNLDRYGRLLAYVYLEDKTFVNAEIIKQGYGYAYTYTKYPFKYMDAFRGYEREAREQQRGLWE